MSRPLRIFTETMRIQRRGLIGWSCGIAGAVIAMSAIWPSFSDVDFTAILEQYPKALMEVFNVADMSTARGFMNAELFSLMIPLVFIIYAIGRGARLVAAEEEDGTMEILATMPVRREFILMEKALALVAAVGVLGLALFVSTVASSAVFSLELSAPEVARGSITMFLLGSEFGLIALAISAAWGRRGLALGASTALAAASYLLYVTGQLIDGIEPFLELSPFYQAISEGPIGPAITMLSLAMPAVGLAAIGAAIPVFARRDLRL